METLSGIKVAVTGGTGFLGVHLVQALTRAGAQVSVLARPRSDRSRLELSNPRWVNGDLSSIEALAELARRTDALVHVAGLTHAATRSTYDEVNVEGTRRAIQAAAKEAVKTFIFISSQAAAGPTPPGASPRRETDPPAPRSNYGKSKWAAEGVVEQEGSGLKSTVILSPGAIYGPYDRAFLAYFRLMSKGLRVVLGRGQKLFQPVWAGDVAEACLAVIRKQPSGVRRYFVVSREVVSWEDFGLVLEKSSGRSARTVRLPEFLVQPRLLKLWPPAWPVADRLADVLEERWEADPGRAANELGWEARMPLEEGVRQTWAWYRQQGWV